MTTNRLNSPTPKPWEHAKSGEGGGSATDPLAARFVESLSFDTRLYDADIRGSIAHAKMLAAVGLISARDLTEIERGLSEIKREIESAPAGPSAVSIPGAWPGWKIELEDVHMCIEAALVAKVGDPGRRLHTGRSRNDQVALDLRLWLRDACCAMVGRLDELRFALAELAARQGDVVMPSYTHLQRAQPICLGAECMAWHAMFSRDRAAVIALAENPLGLSASPLGSGAIAGSVLPLDRALTARDLGFSGGPSPSSIDATASRDEALDFVYLLARIAIHLSRLAEQWIIYASTEFGFVRLGDAHTTGSSMMPQKRNPDMLELIRGKSGGVIGAHVALLTICKGLPLAYNRDLQEDKRHVFAAHDSVSDSITMAARVVAGATFSGERIAAAAGGLDRGYLDATALVEYLVTKSVPFRTAHQIVGALVRLCESSGRHALSQLSLGEINEAVAASGVKGVKLTDEVLGILSANNVVAAYRSAGHGGSGPGGYRDYFLLDTAEPSSDGGLFAVDGGDSGTKGEPDSLIAAYADIGRTLDDLPYTPEFEQLLAAAGRESDPRAILRRLQNLRKAGKLPKVGAAPSKPPRIEKPEEAWLQERVQRIAGSLGQRDQLPYDPRFDELVAAFNQHTGRTLSPHDVWRLVAKLAK